MRQTQAGYWLDREELVKIRDRKLLCSDRDYLYFALQIDYPGKLNPKINVDVFAIVGISVRVISIKPWVI